MRLEKYFDHTFLKPVGSKKDIEKLCEEAKKYDFFSVCVQPCYISYAKELLEGTDVKIATVVGFPQGQNTTATKVFETKNALDLGADEIDMVLNFGALLDGRYDEVEEDIRQVKEAAGDKILKVIFETSQLTPELIIKACALSDAAGAEYVKTSTGFLGEGATVEVVELMVKHAKAKVKASGGIRTLADARAMIQVGASRLGASAGASIMEEYHENL